MGLHFYENPDRAETVNIAAKLDRAAAQRRSTIRREASIRPGRDQHSSSGLMNIIRNRHEMLRARMRLRRETEEADIQIAQLEAELEYLRRERHRGTEQNRARLAQSNSENTPPTSDSTTTTTTQIESHDSSSADNVLLPRPARESNLRFEMAATSTARPASSQAVPAHIPSPPHSLSDISRSRPVDGPLDVWETAPPLTDGFAPARLARTAEYEMTDSAEESGESGSGATSSRPGLETPPPESWENSYPPLRRVSRMSPRPLPRISVDGLGDRHRSPSPTSEAQEEETWNNLLQTLEHSDTSASTSTSFASISDLLASSRSSSNPSSNTQNTSASFGEIGTSGDETCDLPPGITEEDVQRIRERHRRSARRVTAPRRHIPEPDYSIRERGVEHGLTSLAESISSSVNGRERLTQREEIESIERILQRMERREEIPEDMWAMIGLPPEFGRTQLDPRQ